MGRVTSTVLAPAGELRKNLRFKVGKFLQASGEVPYPGLFKPDAQARETVAIPSLALQASMRGLLGNRHASFLVTHIATNQGCFMIRAKRILAGGTV